MRAHDSNPKFPLPQQKRALPGFVKNRVSDGVPRATEPPLAQYFNSLFTAFGPQHWWPGKTPFEVIVGAILTQNTSWKNVELAIANLREAKLLAPRAIEAASVEEIERRIRPSGYFRQKARKLK